MRFCQPASNFGLRWQSGSVDTAFACNHNSLLKNNYHLLTHVRHSRSVWSKHGRFSAAFPRKPTTPKSPNKVDRARAPSRRGRAKMDATLFTCVAGTLSQTSTQNILCRNFPTVN